VADDRNMSVKHGGMRLMGETKVAREKSVSVPISPPLIPNGLAWDRTWANGKRPSAYLLIHGTAFPIYGIYLFLKNQSLTSIIKCRS